MTPPRTLADLHGLPAAAFVRVSTDQQHLSPAAQTRTIERFARDHGLNIVRTAELTISGKDAWRDPAVTEITQAAERGEVRAVIVSTLDRMGRSARTDLFIDELAEAGAVLIDAGNELISGNPAHRRTMRSGIATATNEREIIRDRVTNAIRDRWEAHNDPWGHPSLGLTRSGGEPSLMQIDPATIGQAVRLFEAYATGTTSMEGLVRDFAPIVTHGRRKGLPMTPEGVASLLANPIYNGRVQYKGEWRDAAWRTDPPVSDTLWNQVQQVRQRQTRAGGRHPVEPNGFRHLFYCADCGQRLRGDGTNNVGDPYKRIRHVNPCPEWGTKQRKSLRHSIPWIEAQVTNMEISDEIAADIVAHLTEGNAPVARIDHRREENDIARLLIRREIDGTEAQRRLDAIRERQQATNATPTANISAEQVIAALTNLRQTWALASPDARAALIAATYQRINLRAGQLDSVELTTDAEGIGLPRALPESCTSNQSPLGHAKHLHTESARFGGLCGYRTDGLARSWSDRPLGSVRRVAHQSSPTGHAARDLRAKPPCKGQRRTRAQGWPRSARSMSSTRSWMDGPPAGSCFPESRVNELSTSAFR